MCVHVFGSHQKSQGQDILALGLVWANLKHDEARFSKFSFLRGVPIRSSVKMSHLVVHANIRHFEDLGS